MNNSVEYSLAVFEVQSMLRTLSVSVTAIRPRPVPDGIYGTETRAAVRAFQQWAALPVTGVVDLDTWEALFNTRRNMPNT